MNILGISNGIDNLGPIKWDLFFALLLAWVIVYFSIFRGMKNSRIVSLFLNCYLLFLFCNDFSIFKKVVYITALLPYVFLFTLLIRGLFLPGAMEGISYYLKPDWKKLAQFQVSLFFLFIQIELKFLKLSKTVKSN